MNWSPLLGIILGYSEPGGNAGSATACSVSWAKPVGPVIARMKAGYLNLIRHASIDPQNSNDFFGRSVIPRLPDTELRGRYAARRRVPAG